MLVAYSEALGVAKSFATRHGYDVDPDQELRAFGVVNLASGLAGGLVACGLAVGIIGAAALGQALRSQLFGVEPMEPSVLAATTTLFAICSWVALWWPARRAALVDPASLLRDE